MQKVNRISEFPNECCVKQFFGTSYDDAVGKVNKEGGFISYYEQKHYGKQKSILVSYVRKENIDV